MTQNPSSGDPLRRQSWPYRQGWPFKTVDLNVYGWSALIGAGLALGAVVGLSTGIDMAIALPAGVVASWLVLFALDYRRSRNLMTHLCRGDMDPATGAAIVAQLEAMGVTATYREDDFEADGETFTQRGIVCRHADAETVQKVMDQQLG